MLVDAKIVAPHWPRSIIEVHRRLPLAGTSADGGAAGLQVIIARAVVLIVDKRGIGVDGSLCAVVDQVPVSRAILRNQVINVVIVPAYVSVFLNAVARSAGEQTVAEDNVVSHQRVVIQSGAAREVSRDCADQDSTVGIAKHGVVADGDCSSSVPQVNAPTLVVEGHVVVDVSTKIGMVDAMHARARVVEVPDVRPPVANEVTLASFLVSVGNPSPPTNWAPEAARLC